MIFNDHSRLAGIHAFLSASSHAWTNYDDHKLDARYVASRAARRGTDLHKLAHDLIKLGVPLQRTTATLNQYVNDAIGFRMLPEVTLFVNPHAFGTVDSIGFRNKKLRIHDLKTGINHTSMRQLEVYAVFFCMEYGFKPAELEIELRIYQADNVNVLIPDPDYLTRLMLTVQRFSDRIDRLRAEE